jgi:hypothetical protein
VTTMFNIVVLVDDSKLWLAKIFLLAGAMTFVLSAVWVWYAKDRPSEDQFNQNGASVRNIQMKVNAGSVRVKSV